MLTLKHLLDWIHSAQALALGSNRDADVDVLSRRDCECAIVQSAGTMHHLLEFLK